MKRATTLLSVPVLLASCLLQSACAEPPVVTGPAYDFDWRLTGAAEIEPYQVFDDGQKIYRNSPIRNTSPPFSPTHRVGSCSCTGIPTLPIPSSTTWKTHWCFALQAGKHVLFEPSQAVHLGWRTSAQSGRPGKMPSARAEASTL